MNNGICCATFSAIRCSWDLQILGIRHVNETEPRDHWPGSDLASPFWGAIMLGGAWGLERAGEGEHGAAVATHGDRRVGREGTDKHPVPPGSSGLPPRANGHQAPEDARRTIPDTGVYRVIPNP